MKVQRHARPEKWKDQSINGYNKGIFGGFSLIVESFYYLSIESSVHNLLDLGGDLHTHHVIALCVLQLPLDNDTDLGIGLQNGQTGLVLVLRSVLKRALNTRSAGIGILQGEWHIHSRDDSMDDGGQGGALHLCEKVAKGFL